MNFQLGAEIPSQLEYSPAFAAAIRRMGIGFLTYYTRTVKSNEDSDAPESKVNNTMRGLARECGCDYALSCHTISPSLEVIGDNTADDSFIGVIFDEIEHCRCLWLQSDEPLVADNTRVGTLEQAYEAVLEGYRALRAKLMPSGERALIATHIWPVMLHVAARAGFTVCPKICKELYSPVSFAIGLGAALQYGRSLWADIDLWYYSLIPGHPPEELRDNLVFAYRMGADRAYVEGAGLNLAPAGHQGSVFTLFHEINERQFQLTPHGEVLRWFTKCYIPEHPRNYTFRDIAPEIGIVRFEDSCHGQRYADSTFPDHLYGIPGLPSTPETEEWLAIWHMLTAGTVDPHGLTFFRADAGYDGHAEAGDIDDFYRNYSADSLFSGKHRFFCPVHGVAVYDHLVRFEHIQSCRLLFLAGTAESVQAYDSVRAATESGAVCVMTRSMAEKCGLAFDADTPMTTLRIGKGAFYIAENLCSHAVLRVIRSYLGSSDCITYRLRDGRQIVMKRGADGCLAD